MKTTNSRKLLLDSWMRGLTARLREGSSRPDASRHENCSPAAPAVYAGRACAERRGGMPALRQLSEEARRSECGSSLVELALLLPLMTLMLLGVVEIGRIFYVSIEVNNAARAGAAYGAQSNITAGDTAGMARIAQDDAPNIPGLKASPSYVCACSTVTGTISDLDSCEDTCATGDHEVIFVEVYTSASFTTLSHFPGLPTPFTTYGKAIMRVSQ